jgi:hypothetical protein
MGTNLSERRFREYWDRTADLNHERLRFAEVRDLMAAEITAGKTVAAQHFLTIQSVSPAVVRLRAT